MGNQTSQWFALFFLDPMDRLVKEKLRIRHNTRYMDDCILIHPDKDVCMMALAQMRTLLSSLNLDFNSKTQVFPISSGGGISRLALFAGKYGGGYPQIKEAQQNTLEAPTEKNDGRIPVRQ